METGDTRTKEADGATRQGAKVVRLPREWLGPRDELVPIEPLHGPEADADTILSASAFWSEESAALQGAVQGLRPPHPDARPRIRRRVAGRTRWVMVAAGAAAVLVLAAIGSAETLSGATPKARGAHRPVQSAARSGGSDASTTSAHTTPGASTANDETVGLLASGLAGATDAGARTGIHREHPGRAAAESHGTRARRHPSRSGSHRTGPGSHRDAISVRSGQRAAGSPSDSSSSATSAGSSTRAAPAGSTGASASSSEVASSSGSSGAASSAGSSGTSDSSAPTTARRSGAATETLSPSSGSGLPAPGGPPPP